MNNLLAKITKTVTHPITTGSPFPIIYLTSFLAIWWGVILILVPVPVSADFTCFLATHLAVVNADLPMLGLLFIALGIAKLFAVATNKRNLLINLTWLSTGVWTFLTTFLGKCNCVSIIFGTYVGITIISIWAYWRVKHERSTYTNLG